jgi:hypothetical protein
MKEGISLTCQNTTWYGIVIKDSQKELGQQLQLIYELKLNGLEELIRNIKKNPKPLNWNLYYSEVKISVWLET